MIAFQGITIKSLKMCNETVQEQVFKNNTFCVNLMVSTVLVQLFKALEILVNNLRPFSKTRFFVFLSNLIVLSDFFPVFDILD